MKLTAWLWPIAVILALFLARYQRTTGPTYPISGRATIGGATFRYRLDRTHAGSGDHRVVIRTHSTEIAGTLEWREHDTTRPWVARPMRQESDALVGAIPLHPPGDKVDYRVTLETVGGRSILPPGPAAVLRFRNEVPLWALVPHIVCMMGALLLSMRAGFETLVGRARLHGFTYGTLALLFIGGFPFGMLVSGFAFGQWWSGVPVSNDLTDNKTLIALLGWGAAAIAVRWERWPRVWVAFAAVLTCIVYLIPHSLAMPG